MEGGTKLYLRCQRFTPSGCKDNMVIKLELKTSAQYFSSFNPIPAGGGSIDPPPVVFFT